MPPRDRNKTAQKFMQKHLQSPESQLEAAAKAIEADADYGELMLDVATLTSETTLRSPPEEDWRSV